MSFTNEKKLAVIGHPIAHTMSPFIHARLFALSGLHACYGVLDIPPESLEAQMHDLRQLSGFNVTIPHKQAIIPFLDALDEKAAAFQSVNTVKNQDDKLTGFTTDGTGFHRALETKGVPLTGHTAILGAGGAARALAFEAALNGGRITVAARAHSLNAAKLLCEDLRKKIPGTKAEPVLMEKLCEPMDLLANATPAGMYPHTGFSPVSEEIIRLASHVFDAVYNPNETAFLKLAKQNGIPAIGGMSMLVWQAAQAHKIWYGADFNPDDIAQLCNDAVFALKKEFGNVILCGFMGSGKTTVGALLAKKMNRQFIDLDKWIEQCEGMTVTEIFKKHGEPAFRRLERQAANTLGQKSGLVIAAGGGTLTSPENACAFKENGIIVFLDASLHAIRLRLDGDQTRPLLAGRDREQAMERLYRERSHIYRAAADVIVPADDVPSSVAAAIQDKLVWKTD